MNDESIGTGYTNARFSEENRASIQEQFSVYAVTTCCFRSSNEISK